MLVKHVKPHLKGHISQGHHVTKSLGCSSTWHNDLASPLYLPLHSDRSCNNSYSTPSPQQTVMLLSWKCNYSTPLSSITKWLPCHTRGKSVLFLWLLRLHPLQPYRYPVLPFTGSSVFLFTFFPNLQTFSWFVPKLILDHFSSVTFFSKLPNLILPQFSIT